MNNLSIGNNFNSLNDGIDYSNNLDIYMHEVSKLPLLTKEEEKELSTRVALGDNEAKEKLVEANLKLVVYIARNYVNLGLDLMDLIQEGNIGLIKAVNKFDGSQGYRFSTYAAWWIKQAISRGIIYKSRSIRLPITMSTLSFKVQKLRKEYASKKGGQELTDEEISKLLGVPINKIKDLNEKTAGIISLDAPVSDGNNSTLLNLLKDNEETENIVVDKVFRQEVLDGLMTSGLNDIEVYILLRRFGFYGNEDYLKAIADDCNYSVEYIRQLQNRAIQKLKDSKKFKKFKSFIGK